MILKNLLLKNHLILIFTPFHELLLWGNLQESETDSLLKFRKKEILQDSGKISHKKAIEKAENEYEKYKVIQDKKFISDFDRLLLGRENINKNKIED